MKKPEYKLDFPTGLDFLSLIQRISDDVSKETSDFAASAGKALPDTNSRLGNVLSYLYRISCCFWGCDNGDHVLEWLTGRVVNQAMAAHRLIWAANYDEALSLIRSIGEAANLAMLFRLDKTELIAWKIATRGDRMKVFSPLLVRKKLENKMGTKTIPIDQDRYQRLCEIGTHPVPGFRPGHFTGTGRPILNGIMQDAGVFVCVNELAYAVSLFAIPIARLVTIPDSERERVRAEALDMIKIGVGAFNILNYEEFLGEFHEKTKKN